MLPPASRQASYAYTLPEPGRRPSYAPSRSAVGESDEDDDLATRGIRADLEGGVFRQGEGEDEEEEEGCRDMEEERERGLEETLEKLGFGESAM
jgi:hypothetical protein